MFRTFSRTMLGLGTGPAGGAKALPQAHSCNKGWVLLRGGQGQGGREGRGGEGGEERGEVVLSTWLVCTTPRPRRTALRH